MSNQSGLKTSTASFSLPAMNTDASPANPSVRALRFPELKSEKGIPYSRVHIDRLEKQRKFPSRFYLGPNSVAWNEAEIDRWLEARMDPQRRNEEALRSRERAKPAVAGRAARRAEKKRQDAEAEARAAEFADEKQSSAA